MPKRKRSKNYEEDVSQLRKKLRKLERKIRKHRSSSDENSSSKSPAPDTAIDLVHEPEDSVLKPDDWLPEVPDPEIEILDSHELTTQDKSPTPVAQSLTPQTTQECPRTSSEATNIPLVPSPSTSAALEKEPELDTDILQILGEDPTSSVIYGPDIRLELANRLQYVATEGLDKEIRKELVSKYLTPGNCKNIDAPKINPEIKAAIPDNLAKRDKGIETKQKQMASAISCLSEVITMHLNSGNKNNDALQKLMDASRILCDIQHGDSVTRRNFILFGLKKDMKDHIVQTKIDSCLFGEGLAETLKSAKAVNKSGVDLKADFGNKNMATKPKTPFVKNLNRRAPPPARRTQGTPQQWPRSRAPAASRPLPPQPPPPPPPHAYSSRPSYHHPPPGQAPRRRF